MTRRRIVGNRMARFKKVTFKNGMDISTQNNKEDIKSNRSLHLSNQLPAPPTSPASVAQDHKDASEIEMNISKSQRQQMTPEEFNSRISTFLNHGQKVPNIKSGDFVINNSDQNKTEDYPIWRICDDNKLQRFDYLYFFGKVFHKSVSTYITWSEDLKTGYQFIRVKPLSNALGIETVEVLPESRPKRYKRVVGTIHILPANSPLANITSPVEGTSNAGRVSDTATPKHDKMEESSCPVKEAMKISSDKKSEETIPIERLTMKAKSADKNSEEIVKRKTMSKKAKSTEDQDDEITREQVSREAESSDKNEEIITREWKSRTSKEQAKKMISDMNKSDNEEFASPFPYDDSDRDSDPGWDPKMVADQASLFIPDRKDSEEESPAKRRRLMIPRSTKKTPATACTTDLAKAPVDQMNNSPSSEQQQVNMPAIELSQSSSNNYKEAGSTDQQEKQMDDIKPGDFLINKSDENKLEGYPVWRLSEHGMLQKFEYIDMKRTVIHKAISTYTRWCKEVTTNYKPIKVNPLTNKGGIETIRVLPENQPSKNLAEPPVNETNKLSSKSHPDKEDDFFLNKEDEIKANYPIWRQAPDGTMQKFVYVELSDGKIIHKSVSMYLTCSEDEKQNFTPIKVKALTNRDGIQTVKVLPEYQPASANNASEPEKENEAKRRKIMNQPTETVQTFFVDKKDEHIMENYPIWRLGADSQLQKFEYVDMGTCIIHKSVPSYITWSGEIKNNYKPIKVKLLSNKMGIETVTEIPSVSLENAVG